MYNSRKIKGAIFVDKIQAEEIINSAFTALSEKLQAKSEYNSKEVIDDLHRLAKALQTDNSVALNLHSSEQNLELDYKAIAQESLESYAKTAQTVEDINKKHQEINNCKDLELEDMQRGYCNIYDQIEAEIIEANKTIERLNAQVASLEKSSNIDSLTGTYNRRALDTYLGSLCHKKGFVPDTRILIIDIDDFKIVNDSYGHLAGDRVLIFLGKLINSVLRPGDKVFRFGGEEFLVLLNRSKEHACDSVAERIMKSVRANKLLYKEHQIKITLSIGSACLQKDDTYDSFIGRADKALYEAKRNGKDQLIIG